MENEVTPDGGMTAQKQKKGTALSGLTMCFRSIEIQGMHETLARENVLESCSWGWLLSGLAHHASVCVCSWGDKDDWRDLEDVP